LQRGISNAANAGSDCSTLKVASADLLMLLLAGGMRLGLGGEFVQAITLDSLNITNLSVMKVR
jgi:hypothetical protein